MNRSALISALKAAALIFCCAFFLFYILALNFGISLLIAVLAALLFALLGGLLYWYHRRIDLLEQQNRWLLERLDKLERRDAPRS